MARELLQLVELGGYPDLRPLWAELELKAVVFDSTRKAVAYLRHQTPYAILGEFNYLAEFRDRVSQMESILAAVANRPQVVVVLLYHEVDREPLQRLVERFPSVKTLCRPLELKQLRELLQP